MRLNSRDNLTKFDFDPFSSIIVTVEFRSEFYNLNANNNKRLFANSTMTSPPARLVIPEKL